MNKKIKVIGISVVQIKATQGGSAGKIKILVLHDLKYAILQSVKVFIPKHGTQIFFIHHSNSNRKQF